MRNALLAVGLEHDLQQVQHVHIVKPVSPAQMLYAKKIAQGKGVVIPDEAKASSAAMSAWIAEARSAASAVARARIIP